MRKYWKTFVLCWGIGLALVVLQTVIEPMSMNNITGILKDFSGNQTSTLIKLLAYFCVATILICLGTMSDSILRQKLNALISTDLSLNLLRSVLYAHNSFLLNNEPERIVSRISRDAGDYSEFKVSTLLEIPLVLIGFIATCYMMFFGSFSCLESLGFVQEQKGNILLACIIIAMSPLHVSFLLYNKKFMQIEQQQADAYEEEYQTSTESLRGITDIRASNSFVFIITRLWNILTKTRDTRIRLFSIFSVFQSVSAFIWGITQVIVLGVAAWLISTPDTGLRFQDYMGFSILCGMFNQYVSRAVNIVLSWQRAKPAKNRVMELANLTDEFSDKVGAHFDKSNEALYINGARYSINGIDIINDINLTVPHGQHLALVGPSGCGKSTLLKMIMRHLDPTGGDICYGNLKINEINFADYAKRVAYVSQKPFIFTGTLYDNLFVGRNIKISNNEIFSLMNDVVLVPDLIRKALDVKAKLTIPEISDESISLRGHLQRKMENESLSNDDAIKYVIDNGLACQAVCAGLQTKVWGDGQGLSGGQMAKLALARALIASPEILLLDEVTAPLDELSQEKVTKMLAEKYRHCTIISISHRIPAVRDMDRIIVLDAGKIVQDGNYDSLLNVQGLFAVLVARETGTEIKTAEATIIELDANNQGILKGLALSPVFAEVPFNVLNELATKSFTRKFTKDDFIVKRNDSGDEMFVILSGAVDIGGKTLQAGNSLGEIALFGDSKRTIDVRAKTDTEVAVLKRDDVLNIAEKNPAMLLEITKTLARIAARETARRFE